MWKNSSQLLYLPSLKYRMTAAFSRANEQVHGLRAASKTLTKKDGRREIEPRRPSFLFFRSCVALSRCSERDFFPFFISLVSFATQAVHDLLRLASLESGLKVHDGATPCRAGRPAASPKALTASPSLLASVPVVTRT